MTESVDSSLKKTFDIDPIFKDIHVLYETYYKSHIIKFIVDPQGVIQSVNNAFLKKIKKIDLPVSGQSVYQLFPERFGKTLRLEISSLIQGKKRVSNKIILNINSMSFYELEFSPLSHNLILAEMHELSKIENLNSGMDVLENLFQSLPNSIVIIGRNGFIEWVNEAFVHTTQYKLEDVKGHTPRILLSHVHKFDFYKSIWKTINNGSIWEGKLFNRRKDGSIYLDGQKIVPCVNKNNEITHYIAFNTDAPFMLHLGDHQILQHNLFDNLKDVVIMTDKKFNIVGISKGAKRYFEIDTDDYLGKKIFNVLPLDIKNTKSINIINGLKDNTKNEYQLELKDKHGNKKSVKIEIGEIKDNYDNLSGYVLTNKNKAENVISREDITISEQLFPQIFDSIKEPIIIFDKEFRMKIFNKSALESLGVTSEEMFNKRLKDVFNLPEKYIERNENQIKDVFTTGSIKNYVNEYNIEPRPRIFNSVMFPIKNVNNEIILVGLIFKDINTPHSDDKLLPNSEKLEALGKMAAFISHEMKTPLNSIKMNIDMLSALEGGDTRRKKSFQLLQKEVKRLSHIMKEVLQFTSENATDFEQLSLHKLIDDLKSLLGPLLKAKSITLVNNVEDRKIFGIKNKLETVFDHLIENAIDAIEEEGKIEISSKIDYILNEFIVYVNDTGCGISNSENIYEPFYTTKANGTGLGLSIVKNALKINNSQIKLLKSEPGCTTFELRFPIIT